LDCPLGQVLARTPDASGRSAPGTVARAALALGATEIGRVEPPKLRGAAELVGAAADPAELVGAAADPAELMGATADPAVLVGAAGDPAELVGVAADPAGLIDAPAAAHRAPETGAGGGSYAWSSCGPASLAGVRPATGLMPALSGVACCSSMGPPDRRGPTSVETSGAGLNRAISTRLPASGASPPGVKIRRAG
jgi:hypothetical protein